MKRAGEILLSLILWGLSWLHFLIVVPVLIVLAIFLDPHKHDYLQRSLCRRIAFFSGAKVVVKEEPGFDRARTSFFMVNHVNLFDPFILYCAIPQLVRGCYPAAPRCKAGTAAWRADCAREFGGVVSAPAHGALDVAPRNDHRHSSRHHRDRRA